MEQLYKIAFFSFIASWPG